MPLPEQLDLMAAGIPACTMLHDKSFALICRVRENICRQSLPYQLPCSSLQGSSQRMLRIRNPSSAASPAWEMTKPMAPQRTMSSQKSHAPASLAQPPQLSC